MEISISQAMTIEAAMDRSSDDARHERMKDLLFRGAGEIERLNKISLDDPHDIAARLLGEFEHGPVELEVEGIAMRNTSLGDRMGKIAMRFITEAGLSERFLQVLEEIEDIEKSKEVSLNP